MNHDAQVDGDGAGQDWGDAAAPRDSSQRRGTSPGISEDFACADAKVSMLGVGAKRGDEGEIGTRPRSCEKCKE